jgi:acyl dehydratase
MSPSRHPSSGGRFYEDLDVGDLYQSRLGRTITEVDNTWFTCLTLNTNPMQTLSGVALSACS